MKTDSGLASTKDLQEQLEKNQKELMQLRFEYANARSLSNPSKVKIIRKSIARILTILAERKKDNRIGSKK